MAGVEHVRRSLLDHATSSMAQSIVDPIRMWLAAHPVLDWWLGHPLWIVTLIVVAIALLVGLFGALGRLTENIWLTLFKTLFTFVRWVAIATFTLLKAMVRLIRHLRQATRPARAVVSDAAPTISPDFDSSSVLQTSSGNSSPTRLPELLTRLTLLHQQEETLIAEIKQLLAQNPDAS